MKNHISFTVKLFVLKHNDIQNNTKQAVCMSNE